MDFRLLISLIKILKSAYDRTVYGTDVTNMESFSVDLVGVCCVMQEVLLFPAMKPEIQKKKDEVEVKKSDE